MLVLSRLPDQSIVINGNIRIVVVSVSGNKVKLGFEAPPDVKILRSEVIDRDLPKNGTHTKAHPVDEK